MARWRALARRAWRPNSLLADVALALVVAALSLITLEGQQQERVDQSGDTEVLIQPMPVTPGNPVEITVWKGGKPFQAPNVEPLLTIQNVTTGKWKTYVAKPTGTPGVYRIPAVHPGKGVYSYSVLYGPFEQNVTIKEPNQPAPPTDPPTATFRSEAPSLWAVALTLVATLPIALRRRFPLVIFLITLPAALAMDVLYNSFQFAGALVALYTVAAYVGRPGSIGVGVGTALALPLVSVDEDEAGLAEIVATYVIFAVAWILGDRIGARRAYLSELEERALKHEREREEHARRAAADEQARIARELHDIITHNVSVMTVQAAAAGDVFETHPNRAREALSSIESTGREALTELRRLLGHVRTDGALAPLPGLARLEDLVGQVRSAGLTVELAVEGEPHELPAGVDLSAYRIVQEALTNTLKHAQASNVTVRVRYGTAAVEVEVVDDGRGPAANGGERGRGLIGMRERAALFGGELRAGHAAGGGFSVHARIPLEGDVSR